MNKVEVEGYLVRDKSCPSKFYIFGSEVPPVEERGEWVFAPGSTGKIVPLDIHVLYDLGVQYPSFEAIKKIKITIEEHL